jgi:PncC family amidohydrolase
LPSQGCENSSEALGDKAKRLFTDLNSAGLTVVTAESCTCGRLACLLSRGEGASEILHGGFITYTKENKTAALGVSRELLRTKGAVCEDVARAMAEGALDRTPADLAIAVTGVAGPDPDPDGNPVGRVHIAAARRQGVMLHRRVDYGPERAEIILERTMSDALDLLRQAGGL